MGATGSKRTTRQFVATDEQVDDQPNPLGKPKSGKKAVRRNQSTQSNDSVHIDTKAPATVHFQGQTLRIGLEPGGDGTLVVKQKSNDENETAATRIQAAFRRYQARELYKTLQALEKMQLQIGWPAGAPFIGLLVVRVNNMSQLGSSLTSVRHPILRAKCDGDHSINIPGHHDSKSGLVKYDFRATFVFVVLRSGAVLTLDVLQSLELATRVVGKVRIPIASLKQGKETVTANVYSAPSVIIGEMSMNIGYQWLRGTQDFGGYDGPHFVLVPSRKVRGAANAVERLWQVNHWLCSHDNVWPTSTDFHQAVRMAIEHKRSTSQDVAILTEEGTYVKAPRPLVPELKHQASGGKPRGVAMSSAELLARTMGTEHWERLESHSSSMEHHRSLSSSAPSTSLGHEDWELAMEELYDVPGSHGGSASFDLEQMEIDPESRKKLADVEDSETESDAEESDLKASVGTSSTDTGSGATGSGSGSYGSAYRSASLDPEAAAKEERRVKLAEKFAKKRKKKARPSQPAVTGKFEYGVYRPASKRDVHVFVRRAENSVDLSTPKPMYIGGHKTSRQGRMTVDLPDRFNHTPGHYHVIGLLPDDNTFGRGSVFMLEKGTKCVVFDLDGTITTSDVHVVTQVVLDSISASTVIGSSLGKNYDLKQRTNALTVCRLWAAKGYQIIYLSGRQGSAYNMTASWLIKHGYPPGPIHLTRTHLPTLPIYMSVGHFKVKYMEELISKGMEIYAAYGNTGTDIRAYERIGIPKERTFIVGPNGGKKGTRRITDFTTHLPAIMKCPDAEKPIPYTELLFSSPDTKKGW